MKTIQIDNYNPYNIEPLESDKALLLQLLIKEAGAHYDLKYWGKKDRHGRTLEQIDQSVKAIKQSLNDIS